MPQQKQFFSKKASQGSWASEAPGSRPAASQLPAARRVAAALRRQLQQGLPALRALDGHGVHGPQLLHVAVLRVEAPRRVRRRRVLHRLHAPAREVLVALELVGVVLQQPELGGRLLLHVLERASLGPGRQVLLQCLDAPVHHGRGGPPLRPVHGFLGQLPVQRGELVAQVCRDRKVLVVPRQLLRGALGGPADRLGVLVLQVPRQPPG